jgi:hypothetical protein
MITLRTSTPNALLTAVKKAIDDKKITTWMYNSDGYFTHTPEQWKSKAWFLPTVTAGTELRFGLVRPKNTNISSEVYAIYHGRVIEMMLAHFDTNFTSGAATALPTTQDNIKAA